MRPHSQLAAFQAARGLFARARRRVLNRESTGMDRPRKRHSPEARKMALMALRIAATADGAPRRCRRMKCRAGRCTAEETCGGGLDETVARRAAWMIIFAAELLEATCGLAAAEKFAPPAEGASPRGRSAPQ